MKPIKLTEQQAQRIAEAVLAELQESKLYNGKINVNYSMPSEDAEVRVGFAPMAFAKMMSLVYTFDSEVAWHGTATRTEDGYYIHDIMVYPQTVTGSTVNTDQEEYQTWLMELDDDVFNRTRMQGHSHVNMGTSPSGVDTTHQEAIIDQLGAEDFYIFMIWNKKMERTIRIFDMAKNAMYEDDDVSIYIGDNDFDMKEFLDEAESNVVKKTYTYGSYKKTESKSTAKDKSKSKKEEKGSTWYWDEDDYGVRYLRSGQ